MSDNDEKKTNVIAPKKKNHNKYRREKSWDNDPTIDHWQIAPWKAPPASANAVKKGEVYDALPGGHLLEESSFATLFPKYRESYLRQVWPVVTSTLNRFKIACELNLVEGSMTVRTTRHTSDPAIILKARDLIKLLSRSIPVEQAVKIVNDDVYCDIIKVGGLVRNKERFVKRRQRLLGPGGATLKALELLTECFILVQGNTVSVMGSVGGIKKVRRVVLDCMRNIHPVYNIKRLMIVRELAKDPKLKDEDWNRFLPKFEKKSVGRKKTFQQISEAKKKAMNDGTTTTKKKVYTPFPPPQQPSKIDQQLDSGEYFLSERERRARKTDSKKAKSVEKSLERRAAREKDYEAPFPTKPVATAVSKKENSKKVDLNIDSLKEKFTNVSSNKRGSEGNMEISDFVDGGNKKTKR